MSNEIDINSVIEQLVNRIAQLEFEVAVLKASKLSIGPGVIKDTDSKPVEEKDDGGYM